MRSSRVCLKRVLTSKASWPLPTVSWKRTSTKASARWPEPRPGPMFQNPRRAAAVQEELSTAQGPVLRIPFVFTHAATVFTDLALVRPHYFSLCFCARRCHSCFGILRNKNILLICFCRAGLNFSLPSLLPGRERCFKFEKKFGAADEYVK